MCVVFFVLFFFFKQKTAYGMRISDWSSDVCSSDLIVRAVLPARDGGRRAHLRLLAREPETVRQGGARHHRRRGQAVAVGERDPISGHMTTGHEWNGIKELNTPVPRAIWLFLIATVLFPIGDWLLMPAWPPGQDRKTVGKGNSEA